jgi:hypothetical protein
MTWHLFYIEAEVNHDPLDSTIKAWIVSGESDSQGKAEELVRAEITDNLPGVPDEPPDEVTAAFASDEWDEPHVTCCKYLGVIDRDVFQEIGEIAL